MTCFGLSNQEIIRGCGPGPSGLAPPVEEISPYVEEVLAQLLLKKRNLETSTRKLCSYLGTPKKTVGRTSFKVSPRLP